MVFLFFMGLIFVIVFGIILLTGNEEDEWLNKVESGFKDIYDGKLK